MDFKISFKEEFPLTKEFIYYESARITPPSRSVHDAVCNFYDELLLTGEDRDKYDQVAKTVRSKFAEMINADPEETAIIKNTTEGINIASNGLEMHPGDNVVTTSMEHRNNIYPWLYLAKRGIEVRIVQHDGFSLPPQSIYSQIDKKTKAVGISHVQFLNGFRTDLKMLSDACHEVGSVLVVDAIQSVGKMPIDVKSMGVDILSCGGHKGLFAGRGIGCFYCSKEVMEKLRLVIVAPDPEYRHDMQNLPGLQFPATAKRFEAGSLNYAGVHALNAGLDLVMSIGIENIHEHNTNIADLLQDNLAKMGFMVISPQERSNRGGIVTFATKNPENLVEFLKKEKILVNVRNGYVRLSPHIYNTIDEAHTFLGMCKKYLENSKG